MNTDFNLSQKLDAVQKRAIRRRIGAGKNETVRHRATRRNQGAWTSCRTSC